MPEELIPEARDLVARILEDDPERLHHCAGVAARAQTLVATVPPSAADTLVAAAWLHDIGYGSQLRDSGFHPLDGAVYLRREGWPGPVCDLVAHHSGSRFVAGIRGLDNRLREFEFVEDALSDALTVADNTTGPTGMVMTLDERIRDNSSGMEPNHQTPEPIPSATTIFAPLPGAWPIASPPWNGATPRWNESASSPATTVSARPSGPTRPARRWRFV